MFTQTVGGKWKKSNQPGLRPHYQHNGVNDMTIEKITNCIHGGFFAMMIFENNPYEMFFKTEAEIYSYLEAFNNIGK